MTCRVKTAHAAFSAGFRLISMALSSSGGCVNGGRSGEVKRGFPGRLRRLTRIPLFPNRLNRNPGRLRWAASSWKLRMAGTFSPRPVPVGPVSKRMLKKYGMLMPRLKGRKGLPPVLGLFEVSPVSSVPFSHGGRPTSTSGFVSPLSATTAFVVTSSPST